MCSALTNYKLIGRLGLCLATHKFNGKPSAAGKRIVAEKLFDSSRAFWVQVFKHGISTK